MRKTAYVQYLLLHEGQAHLVESFKEKAFCSTDCKNFYLERILLSFCNF